MQLVKPLLASALFLLVCTIAIGQVTNKDKVKKIFTELVQKKNFAAIDKYYAADVVDHSAFPNQKPGRDGLKAAIKELFDAYPDVKVKVQDIIAEDDLVSTREQWLATDRNTGVKKSGWVLHIFRFKNGVVTEEWSKGWEWLN